MRRDRALEVIVALLLAGAGIGAVGATSAMTAHRDASGWWTAVAACLAAAIWLVVVWLGIHPLFAWGRAKKTEWYAAASTRVIAPHEGEAANSSAGPTSTLLVIHHAIYGAGQGEVDVTERLNGLVSDDVLDIIVDNATMGSDPAPNTGKMLRLRWTYDGAPGASAFLEGTHVVIP